MTLSELIKERRRLSTEYDKANEVVKDLKKQRDAVDKDIIEAMAMQGLDRMTLKGVANVGVTDKDTVTVTDWDAVHRYILETKQPHLLQRRVMSNAILELIADGEELDGIEVGKVPTISFRQA